MRGSEEFRDRSDENSDTEDERDAPVLRMESFETRWVEARAQHEDVSDGLAGLVRGLYESLLEPRYDLTRLREALIQLLTFLTSRPTEANLTAVDAFVCVFTAERNELVERLPDDYQAVIDTMGLDLRETLRDPALAESCGATPELLLRQAQELGLPH